MFDHLEVEGAEALYKLCELLLAVLNQTGGVLAWVAGSLRVLDQHGHRVKVPHCHMVDLLRIASLHGLELHSHEH